MFVMKPPAWCALKYGTLKDVIIGVAESVGAHVFMSASLTFRADDWEVVEKFIKMNGKDELQKLVVEHCRKSLNIAEN